MVLLNFTLLRMSPKMYSWSFSMYSSVIEKFFGGLNTINFVCNNSTRYELFHLSPRLNSTRNECRPALLLIAKTHFLGEVRLLLQAFPFLLARIAAIFMLGILTLKEELLNWPKRRFGNTLTLENPVKETLFSFSYTSCN